LYKIVVSVYQIIIVIVDSLITILYQNYLRKIELIHGIL